MPMHQSELTPESQERRLREAEQVLKEHEQEKRKVLGESLSDLRGLSKWDRRVKLLFRAYDHDNSGVIDMEELRQLMHDFDPLRPKPSVEVVNKLMKKLDTTGDNLLGEDEFADYMTLVGRCVCDSCVSTREPMRFMFWFSM